MAGACSPSLCPKTPAQKPGRSRQSLRKSWAKPEPSKRTGGRAALGTHAAGRVKRCQASPRSQSPLGCILGNTLRLRPHRHRPLPKHEAAPAGAAAAVQRARACAGAGLCTLEGDQGGGMEPGGEMGVPLLPCLQIAATPPQRRCQIRGARRLAPRLEIFLQIPGDRGFLSPPRCRGALP